MYENKITKGRISGYWFFPPEPIPPTQCGESKRFFLEEVNSILLY